MSSVDDQPSPSSTAAVTQPADRDATRTSSPSAAPSEPPPASLFEPAPSSTERYEIISEHGRGGLGRVFRAHDRMLARDVAIKQMLAHGKVSELRFVREALITARLEHPNIVPVHEVGRWPDNTPFYAMKLIAGRPLRDLIAERSTVTERIGLLHHVIAVADAMAYAHERNIIHRDLKPANVIVGDFGETIVIDWGLAKELSSNDLAIAGEALPTAPANDLTATGAIVGTPAYMAPEQGRGDATDQRADVFAIGAMLWELCALSKVPPTNPRQRHHLLRRAGIDPDLITIIDNALAPDPADRYPHAGALAADLKAFKAGTRIAARSYSLLDQLRHWIRRNRTLAIAAVCALATALGGALLYVHDIANARDLAEAAGDRLVLEHAELLLRSDPTAAAELLAQYHGHDPVRAQLLLAEVRGLGVARAVLTPHQAEVHFLLANQAGDILSLAEDRTIKLTHGASTTTLATNASTAAVVAYAPTVRRLAYATTPPGVALLDTETHQVTALATSAADHLSFSADGSRLATVSEQGRLTVWSVATRPAILAQEVLPGLQSARFLTPDRIASFDDNDVVLVTLDAREPTVVRYRLASVTSLEARDHLVLAGTADGNIIVLSDDLVPITTFKPCHTSIWQLKAFPQRDHFAIACQDGGVVLAAYDPETKKLEASHRLATQGTARINVQLSDRYVGIIDESGTPQIYDTQTQLTTRYLGTSGHPTFIATPTRNSSDVLVGDSKGSVRVWASPSSAARAVLHARSAIYTLRFTQDSRRLFASGLDPTIYGIDLSTSTVTELRGPATSVTSTFLAPDQRSLLSYGYDNIIHVWNLPELRSQRSFTQHTGMVSKADFLDDGKQIVSTGDDGKLLLWTPNDDHVSILFSHTLPLTGFSIVRNTRHSVVRDIHGSLWDVSPKREVYLIRHGNGSNIQLARMSPDSTLFAIGTDTGNVTVYDTRNWSILRTIAFPSSIRELDFDPYDRDLLVATDTHDRQPGQLAIVPLGAQRIAWQDVPVTARSVVYSPDGETIGVVCTGGGSWLYSVPTNRWVYTQDHDTDVFDGRFSPNGKQFATSDRRGNVVIRDLQDIFQNPSPENLP